MPHVVLSAHPHEHLPWRDFDHRLFTLLAQLALTPLSAARLRGVYNDAVDANRDIGDPTDYVDEILSTERAHLATYVPTRPIRRGFAAAATRYLP